MTIHYHGTPITPRETLYKMAGFNFCVSFADQRDIGIVHQIGQSVMLDNGAYTAWTRGVKPDWEEYYRWVEPWLKYHTTWAVIPDVIDGAEDENDVLLEDWPHGDRGAPVWHLNETLSRLDDLVSRFTRVCIGSSGEYSQLGTERWDARMVDIFNHVGNIRWFHGLRMMDYAGSSFPFSSVDSANVARNYKSGRKDPVNMAREIDARQCPSVWVQKETQMGLMRGE